MTAEWLAAASTSSFGDTVKSFLLSPLGILVCYLVVINLVTFFVFGFDKLKAKYKETHETARRVPEKTLFFLAIIGGSIGALLGMKAWHHKTLHRSFKLGIPLILILQILIPLGLYLYWTYFRQG